MSSRSVISKTLTLLLACLILGSTLALSGCSKARTEHDRSKVEAGNQKIERMEQIRRELAANDVYLATASKANNDTLVEKMRPVLKAASPEKLAELDLLTAEYAALGEEIQKLIKDKDVTYAGNRDDLDRWIRAAKMVNAEIKELEQSPQP